MNVRTNLDESVHSHNSHVRLWFSVVHQIQVNQFLQLQIVSLHTVDNIWKERRHILADCHACDDLEHATKRQKVVALVWCDSMFLWLLSKVTWRTFFTASFFFSFFSFWSSDFNSNISPFLVVVKYLESVILEIETNTSYTNLFVWCSHACKWKQQFC